MTSGSGDDFQISVGLPLSYDLTEQAYPVLYILDANVNFGTVVETSRLMGAVGEASEVIVVGIGYSTETDLATFGNRRNYDFSTPKWDPESSVRRLVEEVTEAAGKTLRIGGAEALIDFITEQVQPFIAERYRVDTSDQALLGHSLGGHFVGQVLFRRPTAFAKYVISSPGFAYNDWEVLRLEEEYAKSHSDLPVQIYVASGSEEALLFAKLGILSGAARFAEALRLRDYQGLKLTAEFHSGKSHITTYPETVQRSLQLFWPGTPFGP
jgi:predicted alpha/beta superfamily hydrolase